jgi:YhcH/YjgK/YiaL family protein
MALLGRIEDLAVLLHPDGRLRRGLQLLQDCLTGRLASVASQLSSLEPGESQRVPVEGDTLFLLLQCYRTKRRAEGRFEAHQRHTDLQFLWSGCEWIEVCDLRAQRHLPPYDAGGNLYFPLGDGAHSRLLLQAREVAILCPQDAHAPCLSLNGEGEDLVRKIVVKIKDAHLPDAGAADPPMVAAAIAPATGG